MTVLVHIEASGGAANADGLGILDAARAAGLEPVAVVIGRDVGGAIAEVQSYGPSRVLVIDDESLAGADVAPRAAALIAVTDRLDGGLWLAPTTTLTTELAGVLSARLDAGVAWGLVDVGPGPTATRLGGNDAITADIEWTTTWGVGLFRTHTFDPMPVDNVRAVDPEPVELFGWSDRGVVVVETPSADGAGENLAEATIVVAAGRGIGSRENLELVKELAMLLGGVPAVSLPLVEMGWAPRSMQVGQTGTIVAPLLYIACGISGQIQHRVGMERSGTIIAINTDERASIMGWCDLAVVGDASLVVRALTNRLQASIHGASTSDSRRLVPGTKRRDPGGING